jgi:hypothetical protein
MLYAARRQIFSQCATGLRSCQVQAADFFRAIEIGERARNSRRAVNAPSRISPATEAIIETSSKSDSDSSRAASIDSPAPGEPIISR